MKLTPTCYMVRSECRARCTGLVPALGSSERSNHGRLLLCSCSVGLCLNFLPFLIRLHPGLGHTQEVQGWIGWVRGHLTVPYGISSALAMWAVSASLQLMRERRPPCSALSFHSAPAVPARGGVQLLGLCDLFSIPYLFAILPPRKWHQELFCMSFSCMEDLVLWSHGADCIEEREAAGCVGGPDPPSGDLDLQMGDSLPTTWDHFHRNQIPRSFG